MSELVAYAAELPTECVATAEGRKLNPVQLAAITAMFRSAGYEFTQSRSDYEDCFTLKAVRR